ncbi:zf-TFIIB domain-containing protein [Citreimonas sp.]|uniref:TFIIB-type zinc ribbon-containing protein n=1 Tax=Citreimonas sp. TaxID=3036715 RepID=UPI0035C7E418
MQCPIDGTQLVMTDRSGVEIDYCPQCRGVWLDRGELDKIIERASAELAPPPRAPAPRGYDQRGYDQRSYDQRRSDSGYHKKKKGGLLGELFDF